MRRPEDMMRGAGLGLIVLALVGCNGGTVDIAKGASTEHFARVHAGEFATRPTSLGIEADARKLSSLAGKVSKELEQLHRHHAVPWEAVLRIERGRIVVRDGTEAT